MAKISNFTRFLESLEKSLESSEKLLLEAEIIRMNELAGVDDGRKIEFLLISVDPSLILEFQQLKRFKNSSNTYVLHPANSSIPVLRHVHVKDAKGNKELYSVNWDGTAHHRTNRGLEISKREADELRSMGVKLNGNILECLDLSEISIVGYVLLPFEADSDVD